MSVDVVILAAGQGSRMKSKLPKVLHKVGGKAMVQHVIDTASSLQGVNTHVVIGHGADKLREELQGQALNLLCRRNKKVQAMQWLRRCLKWLMTVLCLCFMAMCR